MIINEFEKGRTLLLWLVSQCARKRQVRGSGQINSQIYGNKWRTSFPSLISEIIDRFQCLDG